MLPVHLLKFWYIESPFFFGRIWQNLILYLEEDLAVMLMVKLLFVPLFHDASIIGRVLSFIFRMLRILMGLFAFAIATVLVAALALVWLLLPIGIVMSLILGRPALAGIEFGEFWAWTILAGGVGLFVAHILVHPHQTVWEIKDQDFWAASLIKKNKLNYQNLLKDHQVINLLAYLETHPDQFSAIGILDLDHAGNLAFELAKKAGSSYIEAVDFFVAVLSLTPNIESFLLKLDLSLTDFEEALSFLLKKTDQRKVSYIWDRDFAVRHLKGVNRGWLGVPTPALDRISVDVTRLVAFHDIPDFTGRGDVTADIINLLSQESKPDVIITGAPGSGKSALINFLAKQILAGDAPPALATKRLVMIDSTKLLSGMKTQGELADRIREVFEEVSFAGNIIVVIDEIHNLGIGEAGGLMNIFSLLLPYIEKLEFQFIATTEPENYTKTVEKNGSFARLFTKVELPPATSIETLQILEGRAIEIEKGSKLRVSFKALKKCVELSAKLVHNRVLPDSALDILEEAVTETQGGWVNSQGIEEVVTKRVNVPVAELGNKAQEKLLNLENDLHQKLIDQEEAVKAVSDSLRRSATGLNETARPIGSFLFVGPTGVGKTELAKTLAQVYFSQTAGSHLPGGVENLSGSHLGGGQGSAFIRFDMSEYQSSDSVNKLIGAPGQEGQLTEQIRNKQYGLILLDEFEKADSKVLTIFLQVLDDGRLTDGEGKTVDFTNTIIIATSNAASLTIAHGLGEGRTLDSLKKQVNEELLRIFSPELINRFDAVVLFKPLSETDLGKVVRLKLSGLQKQMKDQGYLIEFDEGLVAALGKRGFDPVMGARPLRRLIQDTIESNLSKMILENKLVKGNAFKVGVDLLV